MQTIDLGEYKIRGMNEKIDLINEAVRILNEAHKKALELLNEANHIQAEVTSSKDS